MTIGTRSRRLEFFCAFHGLSAIRDSCLPWQLCCPVHVPTHPSNVMTNLMAHASDLSLFEASNGEEHCKSNSSPLQVLQSTP